ncbi:MAG: type II secretion system protein GspD, partial [Planctomycetota bacterium]
ENVGLILGVTPRISPDGRVAMEIDAEKSKVGPEEEGIPVGTSPEGTVIRSPRVDTITAQATVSVADGETVVLGGLISTEEESVERRAPYLADIPVLGHLFRYDWSDDARSEMLIILTPRVIQNPEDAEAMKQAEFARMNWCAADVYELYGDIGMDFQPNLSVPRDGSDTEIIYPHMSPRGEPLPTPSQPDSRTAPPDQRQGTPPAESSGTAPPESLMPIVPPTPPPEVEPSEGSQPGQSSGFHWPQLDPTPSNLPLPSLNQAVARQPPTPRYSHPPTAQQTAPANYQPNRQGAY